MISLNLKEATAALAGAIERVDGKPRLRGAFAIVDEVKSIGVATDDLAESLKDVQEPVPASLLAALDLPADSSFAVVAAVIRVMMNTPLLKGEIRAG